MLGKVLKYDMKATAKMFLPMYLCVAVITILAKLSLYFLEEVDNTIIGLFAGTSVVLYVFALFGLMIMTVVFLLMRFYKNFLTDEAYLTFTLPVKTSTLVISKQVNTIFWQMLSFVVLIAALAAVLGGYVIDSVSFRMLWKEIMTELRLSVSTTVKVEVIIMLVLQLIFSLSTFYACLSIGQMYTKHKIWGAVIAYIGIAIVLNTVSNIVLRFVDISLSTEAFFLYSIIEQLAVGLAGLGITYYFLKNKLNLE